MGREVGELALVSDESQVEQEVVCENGVSGLMLRLEQVVEAVRLVSAVMMIEKGLEEQAAQLKEEQAALRLEEEEELSAQMTMEEVVLEELPAVVSEVIAGSCSVKSFLLLKAAAVAQEELLKVFREVQQVV